MTPVAAAPKTETRPTWAPDAASARRAAERAMHAASVAREWAERAGAGQPEAADAARAAERAWDAAMRSRVATDPAEVRQHAAEAIAAAECALEADRRVSQVIAASLWAAEDRRHREQLEPAA